MNWDPIYKTGEKKISFLSSLSNPSSKNNIVQWIIVSWESNKKEEGNIYKLIFSPFIVEEGEMDVKSSKSDQLSSIYLNIFTETQGGVRKPSNNDMIR